MDANYKHRPLKGKIAVVTGAESGIGQAIANELSARGADITIIYHSDRKGAEATLKTVTGNGARGIIVQADVSDYRRVTEIFVETEKQLGTPYILVNDAGVNAHGQTVCDMDIAIFDLTIKTNLYGTFYCCKTFVNQRKKAGGGGKIINITSIHEDVAHAGGAEYCASKGGIRNLTRCLALEVAHLGINVNNVGPGMILTHMNQQAIDSAAVRHEAENHIPLGRAGQAWEVAKLVSYLVSEDAAYATGQSFFIDGGLMINIGQGA
jgi:glucose 1-dehydrogenase